MLKSSKFPFSNRLLSLMVVVLSLSASAQTDSPGRERIRLDGDWRFALGHAYDPAKDFNFSTDYFFNAKTASGDGPAAAKFDDRAWRIVNLPHDWAVELPFDPNGDVGHGAKRVGRPYPNSSVGWYRRTFTIPASDLGRQISVHFDGAFRDAQVYLNGHFLGRFPSGYDSFTCDLTDVLKYGGTNVLAVRLDATLKEGWFYEGAGIYRHVWLVKTAPLHVAEYGTFVTSAVHDGSATVTARVSMTNDSRGDEQFDIHEAILGTDDPATAETTLSNLTLKAGESREFSADIPVTHPNLWSPDSPTLYNLVTVVVQHGSPIDRYDTAFGIRTLRFDKDQGFFLNGQHLLIKGVCCHQDHAGVGVALPDALQDFRVLRLKEMGANAMRTSHNPPTPELLDACDRLGMLVLDENRQTGTSEQAMNGLKTLIRRDRNHPSVFLWSLGNEEWAIEGNIVGARIVAAQRDLAHQLDPSRLVTTAVSGGWGNGSSQSLDVMGFNYYTHGSVDDYHAKHPDQPCIGTEEGSTVSTRGVYFDDNSAAHLSAYDVHAPSWAATAENWVNFYASRPFVAGAFVWTGFDYCGEPTPFGWPAINSEFGILDTCGFPKDNFYYYQSCWTDKPMVHLLPHWNWQGMEGKPISVWCYSNCDEVELSLNGISLGRKPMKRFDHLEWSVKYVPGTLKAVAYKSGKQIAEDVVETTGAPAAVRLIADRPVIGSDGRDVSVITVEAVDDSGRRVPTAENLVSFTIDGPGKIIGVGNGDPSCHEPDVYLKGQWKRSLFNGLAQVIVQSTDSSGAIQLRAASDHLVADTLSLESRAMR
jgi:beta-galactosidase